MGWDYFLVLLVTIIITTALAPKPKKPVAPTIDDFEFPQADEGTPQAVIFGDCWVDGWMVISYGNFRSEEIRSEGGKK